MKNKIQNILEMQNMGLITRREAVSKILCLHNINARNALIAYEKHRDGWVDDAESKEAIRLVEEFLVKYYS